MQTVLGTAIAAASSYAIGLNAGRSESPEVEIEYDDLDGAVIDALGDGQSVEWTPAEYAEDKLLSSENMGCLIVSGAGLVKFESDVSPRGTTPASVNIASTLEAGDMICLFRAGEYPGKVLCGMRAVTALTPIQD